MDLDAPRRSLKSHSWCAVPVLPCSQGRMNITVNAWEMANTVARLDMVILSVEGKGDVVCKERNIEKGKSNWEHSGGKGKPHVGHS